jgi:hypothetical protein
MSSSFHFINDSTASRSRIECCRCDSNEGSSKEVFFHSVNER